MFKKNYDSVPLPPPQIKNRHVENTAVERAETKGEMQLQSRICGWKFHF